ncbi:riboflavin synthase subunit alpha [Vibrio sp. S4M6]|uniref:riboflavin synthase subunit alpha n=1 Tax=Vibrio sinus TaxID=2946865 RepID=UPI002029DB1E|nr:riboflavin synthase subunit alpha [Vibrio sinus]MCL9781874.1 riboflavin synthase subunit alpha [Vibrio sinus]
MFTGIVSSIAVIKSVRESGGIKTFEICFEEGFTEHLEIGASVAVDGVCLTVTEILSARLVKFDVMLQSLIITTLNELTVGKKVNVERAAKDGAEIGGHPLSGHIDFSTKISAISQHESNYCIRFELPHMWKSYVFAKGYIAINGASLTVSDVSKSEGWFEVWLIPETRRATTFELKSIEDKVNIEIERGTQVVVDTVRDTIKETLGPLMPLFEQFLIENGTDVDSIAHNTTKSLSKTL